MQVATVKQIQAAIYDPQDKGKIPTADDVLGRLGALPLHSHQKNGVGDANFQTELKAGLRSFKTAWNEWVAQTAVVIADCPVHYKSELDALLPAGPDVPKVAIKPIPTNLLRQSLKTTLASNAKDALPGVIAVLQSLAKYSEKIEPDASKYFDALASELAKP